MARESISENGTYFFGTGGGLSNVLFCSVGGRRGFRFGTWSNRLVKLRISNLITTHIDGVIPMHAYWRAILRIALERQSIAVAHYMVATSLHFRRWRLCSLIACLVLARRWCRTTNTQRREGNARENNFVLRWRRHWHALPASAGATSYFPGWICFAYAF